MSSAFESEIRVYFMKFTDSTLSGSMLCSGVDRIFVIFGNLGKSGFGKIVKLIALGIRIAGANGLYGIDCWIFDVGAF